MRTAQTFESRKKDKLAPKMGPFGAGAAWHRPTSPGKMCSAHGTGKDGARVRMNVAAHHKKEEN